MSIIMGCGKGEGVVHAEGPLPSEWILSPIPQSLLAPISSQGSVVFDCFEAALGAEVRIWSYTQPRYQKELNFTQQLPGKWLQSLSGAPSPLP